MISIAKKETQFIKGKYNQDEINTFVETAMKDGLVILKNHFNNKKIEVWNQHFEPLLDKHVKDKGNIGARGPGRYYITLPFLNPFNDPDIFEDPDILNIVEKLVGDDYVMCQLATDTPILGSEYQTIHRDVGALFPELDVETPMFQLAVNFPLVDITTENGPFEVIRGTHMLPKEKALEIIKETEAKFEPVLMNIGDVMIRDVRTLHRGTPNKIAIPRPMVVIGYSRKWLFRPEVDIKVPKDNWSNLSDKAKHMLRYNPLVEKVHYKSTNETYELFAH